MTTEIQTSTEDSILTLAPRPAVRDDSRATPAITEAEHRANAEFLEGAYAPNTSRSYRSQPRA